MSREVGLVDALYHIQFTKTADGEAAVTCAFCGSECPQWHNEINESDRLLPLCEGCNYNITKIRIFSANTMPSQDWPTYLISPADGTIRRNTDWAGFE